MRIQLLSDTERSVLKEKEQVRWNVDVTKGQGTVMFAITWFRYIEVHFHEYFTITEGRSIVCYTEDFVGFDKSRFHFNHFL